MGMNYYIADLHFGHQSILALNMRPFHSATAMEEMLIHNWNSKVSDQDDIYILGDLFFHCDHPDQILQQLKGKKHLILGNHDLKWLTDELKTYFHSIHTSFEFIDQNHTVFLCHYPMLSYPKQSRAYMIHGHIHNDTLFDYWPVLLKRKRILNAGVDINHFEPVTFNELLINNDNYRAFMINSYPMFLLSVRFHSIELKQRNLSKTELYETFTDFLKPHMITLYRQGLYLIENFEDSKALLDELRLKILNTPQWLTLIKNFDVVHVDENGSYSYLVYLNKETIYMK